MTQPQNAAKASKGKPDIDIGRLGRGKPLAVKSSKQRSLNAKRLFPAKMPNQKSPKRLPE